MPEKLSALLDGTDAELPDTRSIERDWGISFAFPLFGPRIRILFVIDGRINTSNAAEQFGLGYVLNTLENKWFAWWVRYEVTVVNRDLPEEFRFTAAGFDLDDFDQVWFFGDNPGGDANNRLVGDSIIENEDYSPLSDAELRIIARWMAAGGGVFATGDHRMLGASMCYRIPRVRSMRKWTSAQGVPPFGEPGRHETLQPRYVEPSEDDEFALEEDVLPQRISPVFRPTSDAIARFQQTVHPILCGRNGIIDQFPDHMHEGEVVEGHDVDLESPLDIPGFDGDEYPRVRPQVAAALLDDTHADPLGVRLPPEVIAYGWTTNTDNEPRRFPLLAVYNGEPAQVGRVVVDSTWHHWFSMNLIGFHENNLPVYRGMQDYYRNVALWLATPQQRASMLIWATWGVLVGKHPGAMDPTMGVWELGRRVLGVLGHTAPPCLVTEIVDVILGDDASAILRTVPETDQETPAVAPIRTLVNQAIVGGMALELLADAHEVMLAGIHGKAPEVDAERIGVRARAGARAGLAALRRELVNGARQLASIAEHLPDDPDTSDRDQARQPG